MMIDKTKYTLSDYFSLKNLLDRKTRELEIMETAHCFKDSPRQQKLEAVENLYGEYPTREMCRVLNLDHGTFLNHHYRRVNEKQNELRDNMLKIEIKRVLEESEGRFGINKIYQKLTIEGFRVSKKKISDLFKEIGLKSKFCKRKSFTPQKDLRYGFLKNKLNRRGAKQILGKRYNKHLGG